MPGLVEASGQTREHVARACRRHLNTTPTQIVLNARLRTAARLLGETDLGVLAVCYDSGFSNAGYFHKCFRAKYGSTPRAHRLRQRGVVPPDQRT